MISYVRGILGTYIPLEGDGISSINIEYLISAIILIMCVWFTMKLIISLFRSI